MNIKKILKLILVLILVWYLYIWIGDFWFYKSYDQQEINEIFRKKELPAPVYDSINIRGYRVFYLTNKPFNRNNERKPFLFLLHDSGYSSNYFFKYFENQSINESFNIIAVDRIGFGKTHLINPDEILYYEQSIEKEEFGKLTDIITSTLPSEILDLEGKYIEPVYIISSGNSGLLALEAYMWQYVSVDKCFLFYPEIDKRDGIKMFYSKLITNKYVSYIFPRNHVNKHKDLLFMEKIKEEKLERAIEHAKYQEEEYLTKSIFFISENTSKAEKVDKLRRENFVSKIFQKKNIQKTPEFVMDIIQEVTGVKNYRQQNISIEEN